MKDIQSVFYLFLFFCNTPYIDIVTIDFRVFVVEVRSLFIYLNVLRTDVIDISQAKKPIIQFMNTIS